MDSYRKFLYRFAGTVPAHIAECPLSEQQRYRNLAYSMGAVAVATGLSGHHAAVLFGVTNPSAWLVAIIWACFMVAVDRWLVIALVKRENHSFPWLTITTRLALVITNASVLTLFAILAVSQEGLSHVRFEQKKRALVEDSQFFSNHFRIIELHDQHARAVTELTAVRSKLTDVPQHIKTLRDQKNSCAATLVTLRQQNSQRRAHLQHELVSNQQQMMQLKASSVGGHDAGAAIGQAESHVNQLRRQLATLDEAELSKAKECKDISAADASESRRYFEPLQNDHERLQNEVETARESSIKARRKAEESIAESEQVAKTAHGFNLSGEIGALGEHFRGNGLAVLLAAIVAMLSITFETMPIGLKLALRGGPYDQRTSREEQLYEATLHYSYEVEIVQQHAEAERAKNVIPEMMAITKPLVMFQMLETDVAKAQAVRTRATHADPSRTEEVGQIFNDAVRAARSMLQKAWAA